MKIIISDKETNITKEVEFFPDSKEEEKYIIYKNLKSFVKDKIYQELINDEKAWIVISETSIGPLYEYELTNDLDYFEYDKLENKIDRDIINGIDKLEYKIIDEWED